MHWATKNTNWIKKKLKNHILQIYMIMLKFYTAMSRKPSTVVVAQLNFTQPCENDSPIRKWSRLTQNGDFDAKL